MASLDVHHDLEGARALVDQRLDASDPALDPRAVERVDLQDGAGPDLHLRVVPRGDGRPELEHGVVDEGEERGAGGDHRAGVGEALRDAAGEGGPDLGAGELLRRDGGLGARLVEPGVAHLQRDLRRQVVAVGDAPGLQEVVGALLLGLGVGAVRLGHGERGPGPVVREAVVGVVEDGQHVALLHPRALLPEDAEQAGLDLGHHLHLGAGLQGAGEDELLGQVALLDEGGAHGEAPRGGGIFGPRAARAGGEGEDGGREQEQVSRVHGVSQSRSAFTALASSPAGASACGAEGRAGAGPPSSSGSRPIT